MVIIREARSNELRDLAAVYRQEYNPHNIFQQPERDVLEYLTNLEVAYLVCVEGNEIIGGVAIVEKKRTANYSVFRFKHFAVLRAYHKSGIPEMLLRQAEKWVKKGKVEIHVSETETPDIEFYMSEGYAIEGELSDHYRQQEKCYVLGKMIK